MPAGYPIANDLNTNDARKALSAAMGYKLARTHWFGKKWYGFGTSTTDTSGSNPTGKYPPYLAALSGMTFVNHGHGGSGITNTTDGVLYNDIMTADLSDADLITLEIGNNDSAPLGSIYDGLPDETVLNGRNHDDVVRYTGVTDNSTLCGALNIILRHLLSTTNAQIAVISGARQRYIAYNSGASAGQTKYFDGNELTTSGYTIVERDKAIEDVCTIHSVHFIKAATGLGLARLNGADGNDYVVDNVHLTDLGGYNFAQAIWSQLRNIPLFYTQIPT